MVSIRFIPLLLCCLILAPSLISCGCICECEKQPGCTTLEARTLDGDSLIESATFCSTRHLYEDGVVSDSVEAFELRHFSLQITRVDSVLSTDEEGDLSCREARRKQEQGWQCTCDK